MPERVGWKCLHLSLEKAGTCELHCVVASIKSRLRSFHYCRLVLPVWHNYSGLQHFLFTPFEAQAGIKNPQTLHVNPNPMVAVRQTAGTVFSRHVRVMNDLWTWQYPGKPQKLRPEHSNWLPRRRDSKRGQTRRGAVTQLRGCSKEQVDKVQSPAFFCSPPFTIPVQSDKSPHATS